jgi:3',5'-cyclic AMP phosphodiesterase CpdA
MPAGSWLCAHISDLHVVAPGELAGGAVDTAPFLAAAVEHLNRLDPQPDMILATGDLVDGGRAEQYDELAALVAPLRAPLHLLPGNHDDRAALRAAFPGHGYLRGAANAEAPLDYVVDGPVRVVALDTLVPGAPGGRLSRRQLTWLDEQLAVAPERPALVALHHPPFATGIGHMDRMALDDSAARQLAQVIQRHSQVERVVCGHLHRTISHRFAGTVAATVPSVAHSVAFEIRPGGRSSWDLEPPAISLYLWRPELGLVAHQVAIGIFPGGRFRE